MARTTSRTILAEWGKEIGSVPSASNNFVCRLCLGPVSTYRQCSACHEIFHVGHAPEALQQRVVPMTSALNPSPWYSALAQYKGGFQPRLGDVLASVVHHFLQSRADRIRESLGGEIEIITPVPSKRAGVTYATQPLRIALAKAASIAANLAETLQHDPSILVARRRYAPAAFTPGPTPVTGKRVVLIEDSWVSGATAVSAAGALPHHGAASVLIMPVARIIPSGFWPDDHPYREAMKQPWDPDSDRWPR